MRHSVRLSWSLRHCVVLGALAFLGARPTFPDGGKDSAKQVDGQELFLREWLPGDSRSHGGDGLGPVFNDTSCVACHNEGGAGGGGPREKNVQIVTPFLSAPGRQGMTIMTPSNPEREAQRRRVDGAVQSLFSKVLGKGTKSRAPARPIVSSGADDPGNEKEAARSQEKEELASIHPGLRAAGSVVLHKFGVDDEYARWRSKFSRVGLRPRSSRGSGLQSLREMLRLETALPRGVLLGSQPSGGAVITERNPPALFGLGKLDSIPEEALLAAAREKHPGFPEVSGRVAKLKDGRIGRFGWKGQKASLRDFVLTACAVELGLNVPGEPQAGLPHKPGYTPPGLDLTSEECDALTSYIRSLPRPAQHEPGNAAEGMVLASGKSLFTQTGCASCHVEKLGGVEGVYSDLLLHDMGPDLGDSGNYGSFVSGRTKEDDELTFSEAREGKEQTGGASRTEWRTPPLWGLRDSAPYLHDGRAATIEQAVAMHGGEAEQSAKRFFDLRAEDRMALIGFLKSLTAP